MISRRQRIGLWTASIAVVAAIHAGIAYWSMHWRPTPLPVPLPPPVMMIELPPLPPAPKVVQPPTPVLREPEPEPEQKIVEAPKPRLEIAKPKPKPKPTPKPPEPKPKPKAEPKPEPAPAKPAPSKPSESTATNAAQTTQKATKTAPAQPSAGPSAAEVSWQSRLMGHLARYKRYPDDARRRNQEGTVRLRFTVDANGNVLAHSLVGRSGSASLDRATMQMIRRAQPLPKPPADILRNGSIEVVAPFVYALERR